MKNDRLLKMFFVFFAYFLYTMYAGTIFNALGFNNTIIINFISDVLFMIFIILMYKDNLKEDIKKFKKYKPTKLVGTILLWVVIIFVFNMVCGMITEFLAPGYEGDGNTEAVYNLFNVSTWYTIFKTMIFGTLAEEILYRESVRDNVKSNILFALISAVIYTVMNLVFTGIPENYFTFSILINFLPAIFFSIAYMRNDNNILLLSLIKFCYNLIPLTVLLLGI